MGKCTENDTCQNVFFDQQACDNIEQEMKKSISTAGKKARAHDDIITTMTMMSSLHS